MDKARANRRRSPGASTTILALLLVVCLAESATEQRINSRGKSSLIDKVNGWRSQRGGSCLSYGHSCWGAHGKRSGRPPVTAPDWYLTRMLRRMTSNNDVNHVRQFPARNDDLSAIFQVEIPNEVPATERAQTDNEDVPVEIGPRTMEAKPMLDDELLSKIKIWQLMREASEN